MKKYFLFIGILLFCSNLLAQSPASKTVAMGETKISYYDIGNAKAKKALVLVHCWTCNVEFWRDTYNAFPGYRVIAMDLPGHGKSDKPRTDYTMEFFAKAVDAVMKDAGVKQAVFVGHSMGTPIIRRYYELYPKKTLGLVIVDGSLIPYGPREEVDKFFAPLFTDYKTGAPKFVDGMMPKNAELTAFIRPIMLGSPDYVGQSAMHLMNEDAYTEHGAMNVPALAIMAPSPYWPADLETKCRAIIPKLEFQMWPGTSHFLHMERPKEFNGAVKGFIIRNRLL